MIYGTKPPPHAISFLPLFSLLTLILISGTLTLALSTMVHLLKASPIKLSCVPIWNCLPPHCVLATSSCSFKNLFPL